MVTGRILTRRRSIRSRASPALWNSDRMAATRSSEKQYYHNFSGYARRRLSAHAKDGRPRIVQRVLCSTQFEYLERRSVRIQPGICVEQSSAFAFQLGQKATRGRPSISARDPNFTRWGMVSDRSSHSWNSGMFRNGQWEFSGRSETIWALELNVDPEPRLSSRKRICSGESAQDYRITRPSFRPVSNGVG